MKLPRSIVALYHNVFNIKFAILSAVINGGIVIAVNWSYGPDAYWHAGFSQALASFFSTGVTARVVQHFSFIRSPWRSYFWGSLVPATLTFAMSFSAHWYNGTPELLYSCMPATTLSYFSSYVTNYLTRHGHLLPGNYPKDRIL
ncbi:MAG: hypothetical protein KGI41_04020 [Patescibacteria group bacterium]|nr:hypothetical protein [Patescibacteria group bacterium]MDE1966376.1 hypothetical protein [Patescibacteria group bacterium]